MISFGRHICNDFNFAIEKEWLMTNRKGSYASSTILMTNTRKYHGLLVAKLPGMDNRVVVFPNCDEEIEMSGHIYHISTHKYRETIFPKGFSYLENFSFKDDVVTFLYLIDNVRLKKEIFLMKDSNTVVINYTILTPNSHAKLHVKPFIAFREAEHLVKEIPVFYPDITNISGRKIKISAYSNFPPGFMYLPDGGEMKMEGVWYRDFYYMREGQSGFDATEDLYNIGVVKLDLDFNETKSIVYSTEDFPEENLKTLRRDFKAQLKGIKETCFEIGACVRDEEYRLNVRQLVSAADSFDVRDAAGNIHVVAGYMWPHYIWYRDAFASLPGLFLVLKKFDQARRLLQSAIELEKGGLIPMSMTIEKKEQRYSSVDTTLWYFYALYKYLLYTKDFGLVAKDSEFFKRLTFMIKKHSEGTDFNIHRDSDDLLYAGLPGLPLTWMDTVINGNPATPRQGKAVEVNALWYNAIRAMQYICANNGSKDLEKSYGEFGDRIFKSFNEAFWNEEGGFLYDFIDGTYKDTNVRPNQVLAISLPFSLIEDKDKKEKIMNTVIKELYTSFGLRTLSNMSTAFKSTYSGDQQARDRALHQGTVWAWTAGHFVTAYFATYGKCKDSLSFIETVYEPFFEHLKNAGLGTVSEMFDGSFPYNAKGRISHAWAVGELVRSYFEDYAGGSEKE
jgi:predicted glycogen debranching enzyme